MNRTGLSFFGGVRLHMEVFAVALLGLASARSVAATFLDVGEAVTSKGATVVVDLVLTSDQDVAAMQFDLRYDNRRLTTETAVLSPVHSLHAVDSRDLAPGRLRVAVFSSENAVLVDGPLVSLPFVVAPNVGPGNLPLTVDVDQVVLSTVSGLSIPVDEVLNGGIAVDETLGVFRIAGRVRYFGRGNDPLPEIRLRLLGANGAEVLTDAQGRFELVGNGGGDYQLEASAPGLALAPEAGVNVGDLVAMRKHLLGFADIDSAFGALAGDVDGDRALSELDVERLRKLILGEPTFLVGSLGLAGESLFFLPEDLSFPDRRDPWAALGASNVNAVRKVSGLLSSRFGEDFAGIKLGDVNGDWRPLETGSTVEPSDPNIGTAGLFLRSGFGVRGGEIRVPLIAKAMGALLGIQFDLIWDPSVLEFDRFDNVRLPGFDAMIHSALESEDEHLRVVWDDPLALGLQPGSLEPVLELVFQTSTDAGLGKASRLSFLGGAQGVFLYGFDGRHDVLLQDGIVALAPAPEIGGILSVGEGILGRYVPGETMEIWAFAEEGRTYSLETTESVTFPNWVSVGEAVAAGNLVQFSIAAGDESQRYFRLLEFPIDR